MTERPKHLFVERQTYRLRRLQDGARLLPVVGLVLWMIPMLWVEGPPDGVSTSSAIIYVFGIWAGLAAVAMVMSLFLRADRTEEDPEAQAENAPLQDNETS